MKYAKTISGQKCRIIKTVGTLNYCRFERINGMPYYQWVDESELVPTKTEVFISFCKWCGLRRADAVNILIIGQWLMVVLISVIIAKVLYNIFSALCV